MYKIKRTLVWCLALFLPLFYVQGQVQIGMFPVVVADALEGIEQEINEAFTNSIYSKEHSPLQKLGNRLFKYQKDKNESIIAYWRGYVEYQKALYFYFYKNDSEVLKSLSEGVNILENITVKTSDDYALLAKMQSFYIDNELEPNVNLIKNRNENSDMAIELDPNNLRANLVAAIVDMSTPDLVGGKQKAEKYLLKCISLHEQPNNGVGLPKWGKDEAYEKLIKLYLLKNDSESAEKYLLEAKTIYPKNNVINSINVK